MTITLTPYPSPYYPIKATYKHGSITHTRVFATEQGAIDHLTGRFGNVRFINKLHKEGKAE